MGVGVRFANWTGQSSSSSATARLMPTHGWNGRSRKGSAVAYLAGLA